MIAKTERLDWTMVNGACVDLADFTKDLLTGSQGYLTAWQTWLADYRTHLNRRRGSRANRKFEMVNPPFIPHDPSTDTGRY